MPRSPRPVDSDEGGFALIQTIWTLGLLAALAATVASISTQRAVTASAGLQLVQADQLADAGIRLAWVRSVSRAGPAEFACRVPGGAIHAEVRPAAARIDINLASPLVLSALFEEYGLSKTDAEQLAARIADYRDADDDARPNGMERQDYARMRLDHSPANAPFGSVVELGYVPGVTAMLIRDLQSSLTVHARTSRIERDHMGPAVAAALRRYTERAAGGVAVDAVSSRVRVDTTSGRMGEATIVRVVARTDEGTVTAREVVFAGRTSAAEPPRILTYATGQLVVGEAAVPAEDSVDTCPGFFSAAT